MPFRPSMPQTFTRTRHMLGAGFLALSALFSADAAAQSDTPDFKAWLSELRAEARNRGVSKATLDIALADVQPIQRVIELDRRQPEFTRTFWSYMRNRVTENRIERGQEMLKKHATLLDRVAREYGVPKRYLVAFWGMETNFGAHLGSFPVVGALATLAHDERRAEFFRAQLLDALNIIDGGHIEATEMKGSWAGAMGHLQFIPSTFVRHAVDGSGDGEKDIWHNLEDAFASGANYLSNLGWAYDERWGREVTLPADFDWRLATMDVQKPLSAWAELGVRTANDRRLPIADMSGSIVLPQGHNGPAFLVYDNFRAILSWNRSINYAIAVGHLADRIIGLPAIKNGRDVSNEPLKRQDAESLQKQLNELGFDAGAVDGLPGPQTRAAIRRFQAAAGLPQDGHPDPKLLKELEQFAQDNG